MPVGNDEHCNNGDFSLYCSRLLRREGEESAQLSCLYNP